MIFYCHQEHARPLETNACVLGTFLFIFMSGSFQLKTVVIWWSEKWLHLSSNDGCCDWLVASWQLLAAQSLQLMVVLVCIVIHCVSFIFICCVIFISGVLLCVSSEMIELFVIRIEKDTICCILGHFISSCDCIHPSQMEAVHKTAKLRYNRYQQMIMNVFRALSSPRIVGRFLGLRR
jgi:hypothetical protein